MSSCLLHNAITTMHLGALKNSMGKRTCFMSRRIPEPLLLQKALKLCSPATQLHGADCPGTFSKQPLCCICLSSFLDYVAGAWSVHVAFLFFAFFFPVHEYYDLSPQIYTMQLVWRAPATPSKLMAKDVWEGYPGSPWLPGTWWQCPRNRSVSTTLSRGSPVAIGLPSAQQLTEVMLASSRA